MLQNVKNTSHITVSVCYYIYKLTEHSISSLGRFLECQKYAWYVYTHNAREHSKHLGVVCIYQANTSACVITYTYDFSVV